MVVLPRRKLGIIGGLVALLTSCVSSPQPFESQEGEIVRIYQPAGDFYTARQERKPLTFIFVRLDTADAPRRSRVIKISVFDIYSAAVHGAVGDRVRFSWAQSLLSLDEVPFARLREYRVVRRTTSRASLRESGVEPPHSISIAKAKLL